LTAGLLLRTVEPDDLDALFDHQRDPEANRMAAFPARDRPAFEAHWRRILADDAAIVRTIVWNGEIAGNVLSWPSRDERLVGYLDRPRVLGPGNRHRGAGGLSGRGVRAAAACTGGHRQPRLDPRAREVRLRAGRRNR
jgi:hypothetical protein